MQLFARRSSPVRLLLAFSLATGIASARQPVPSGDLLIGRVAVTGGETKTIRFGFDGSEGIRAFSFSTEGRAGVAAVVGGHCRIPGANGTDGLTLVFFAHFYADGAHFLEGQILNDGMKAPTGAVEAEWRLEFRGQLVTEGKRELKDECGVGFHSGDPRYAPKLDAWALYTVGLPDPKTVKGIPKSDADPVADPDPHENTHKAGSPRNAYVAVDAAKFHFTDDERYLARLMDFVDAQARRPYHLSEADGTPFHFSRYPEAHFLEGKPERKPYRETFGRLGMTEPQLASPPQNGWDQEHLTVEELFAAYVLFGSRIARRELLLIAEQVLTKPNVKEPGYTQHSARAFGWTARVFVRAYQASGDERYLDAVRRMMDSVRKHAVMEGAYRAFVPQDPRNDHIADERWESPFMVAVAASAIALYLQVVPADERARELLGFCGDLLVDQGYSPTNGGFYYDYSVDSSKKSGDGASYDGVVLWIPSALVEVAAEMPEERREKYLGPARTVFQKQMQQDWSKPSQPHFHKWLLRAAREFR